MLITYVIVNLVRIPACLTDIYLNACRIVLYTSCIIETITHTPNRFDEVWMRRICFDLLTEVTDMHGNRTGFTRIPIAPYLIKQLLLTKYLSRMTGQEVQQIELFGRQ